MLNDPGTLFVLRIFAELRLRFENHPKVARIGAAAYGCFGLAFLIVGRITFNLAPSILLAYAIGLTAIGLSGYALQRISKILPARASASTLTDRADGKQDVAAFDKHGSTGKAQEEQEAASLAAELFSKSEKLTETERQAKAPAAKLVFKRAPIVTIPQRKIALIAGEIVEEDGGLAADTGDADELRLAHALAFATKNKAGIGRTIMVRLAVESLDGRIVDELVDLMTAAPELAGRIVFELPPQSLDTLDETLISTLQGYRGLGVQFAARKDSAFEISEFISHGRLWSAFSYILMPAKVILATSPDVIALVDPLGPKIVALDVSSNDELLEILDFQVPLAAGPHFEGSSRSETDTLRGLPEKKTARRARQTLEAKAVEPARAPRTASKPKRNPKARAEAQLRPRDASSRPKPRRTSSTQKELA